MGSAVVPTAVFNSGSGNIVVTVGTSVPGGVTTDVKVEVPGSSSFTVVGNNVGTPTFAYNPGAHGVYKFQVRTNSGGASSDWSPTARATF